MKTKTENIHIIFKEFSRNTLTDNKELNIESKNIISLEDDLRVGPISNLNNRVKDRKNWLSNVFGKTYFVEKTISNVDKDIEKIDKILKTENPKTFYFWTFKNALDIISTAKLITKLIEFNVTVFIIDFNEITLQNKKGNSFYPKSLIEVNSPQVYQIFKNFKRVETEELVKWKNLWKKIESENSLLRILDNNGDIKSEKETYFDNLLKSFCSDEFKKSARIIGETLIESEFSIPDWYLNWRLKKLSEMKKIETIGELKDIRDYKVKSTTYNTL
ncbi:DUF3658 domain-containing protein [Hyunsoonleella pacifica]|uniref:DUF1835 domain-containing protein n=1 Tax=Hyunsoonleella pacifica TaxID=1080224 RepID=A0A4Q9FMI1_9FLAO|nr:DUF3658 domain-containing protein [Hyunsoonleella pacifica]TBN14577.1 DUF1835 domain-containing protein [Hyunsoonleella pacifica]GGD14947.1 hypothetical protein GCM10011368_16120 [Hyunsoonleella pacifica]